MEYKDLFIEIESDGSKAFQVELRSPLPVSNHKLKSPIDALGMRSLLGRLEELVYLYAGRLPKSKKELSHEEDLERYLIEARLRRMQNYVGKRMYRAVFYGRHDGVIEHELRKIPRGSRMSLRLRLEINPNDAAVATPMSLPWELMRAPEQDDAFARLRLRPLVRHCLVPHLQQDRLTEPRTIDGSEVPMIKVLAASGLDDASPGLSGGSVFLERIRAQLGKNARVEMKVLPEATLESLELKMRSYEPHVVYLLCHGTFVKKRGVGYVYLLSSSGGEQAVEDKRFAQIFKEVRSVRLVVLANCTGGALRSSPKQPRWANTVSALLRTGLPAVVAMQHVISVYALEAFSSAMFADLSRNDPIDAAVSAGRKAIYQHEHNSLEWATPVLYSQVLDGHLIPVKYDPGEVAFEPYDLEKAPLYAGIRVMTSSWGSEIERKVQKWLPLHRLFLGERRRLIRRQSDWQRKIAPAVARFMTKLKSSGGRVMLFLPCHGSIAFAAGFHLDRSRLPLSVVQRGEHGDFVLWPNRAPRKGQGATWSLREEDSGKEGGLALAISLSTPIDLQLRKFAEHENFPKVRRIVWCEPEGGAYPRSIEGVAHGLRLIDELKLWLLKNYTAEEREEGLHIFFAAPNGFMFFLGQQAASWGRVQLWEYPHGAWQGEYLRAIELLPPDSKHGRSSVASRLLRRIGVG